MRFGQRIRKLQHAKELTRRQLAAEVDVEFNYISKIENGRLDSGDSPCESLIHRLSDALHADETELMLLAETIPETVKRRIFKRPESFLRIADLDDQALDNILKALPQSK